MDKRMRKRKGMMITGCMLIACCTLLGGCDTQKNSNHITTETSQNTGNVEPIKEGKTTTAAAGEAKSEQDADAGGDMWKEHTKKEETTERQSDTDTAREYVTTDENGETIILQPQSPTNLPESKPEETVNTEKNANIEKPEESENTQNQEPEPSDKTEETKGEKQEASKTDDEKKSVELELPFVPRGE